MTHRILLREVVIDVPAEVFGATRDFWAGALGARPRRLDDYPEFTALDDAAALPFVGLQELGEGPARLHLDIETDDVDAEVARLRSLGAVELRRVATWVMLRDPAGLVFCVVEIESPDFAERSREVG